MDGASLVGYREMKRVIKFVPDTKLCCLKLQPKHESEVWDLASYCDSDWVADTESRIIVPGFIMYLPGVPIFGELRLRRELHCPAVKLSTWLCQKR